MKDSLEINGYADRTKINRWVRSGITASLLAVTLALSIWAYRFYEYSPWTRDGRVRVYVVDTAPEVGGLVVDVPVVLGIQDEKGNVEIVSGASAGQSVITVGLKTGS